VSAPDFLKEKWPVDEPTVPLPHGTFPFKLDPIASLEHHHLPEQVISGEPASAMEIGEPISMPSRLP